MFSQWRSDRSRNRNRSRSRPSLESLEGRQLLTLGPVFSTPINPTTINPAFINTDSLPANASSANGSSVVVWTSAVVLKNPFNPFGNVVLAQNEVLAQRLNSAGGKVGSPIVVSGVSDPASPPSVAIDNQGDFVVAWTQLQPNGNPEILAQKYGPAGNAIGVNVPVAVGTLAQTDPHVAMDAAGDFVVSYTRNTNNNNPDIFAKLYNVNEQQVSVVSVATSSAAETNSSVAMAPDGRFDVAYEVTVGQNFHDIVLNQYSAQGGLTASRTIFAFASGSGLEASNPSVSVDNSGNAVVAWQQFNNFNNASNILARRVSSTGVEGPVLTIANSPGNLDLVDVNPSVALKRDGSGAFVVAYDSDILTTIFIAGKAINTNNQLLVAEVSPTNTITTLDAGTNFVPAVSINNTGQYLLTYTDGFPGQNVLGRFGQLPPSIKPLN
jgi:hypothetical protein